MQDRARSNRVARPSVARGWGEGARLGILSLALLAAFVGIATADMVQTVDGKWTPVDPAAPALGPNDQPTDDLLAAAATAKVDATYETVKNNQGFSKPAGQVKDIIASDQVSNEKFHTALTDATGGLFGEAAEGLLAASTELQLFGKQSALWKRVQAYAAAGAADKANPAIDDLLVAFPKTFYFCDAMILRAKIAVGKSDVAGASKALDAVKTAAGMNSRDVFRSEQERIRLTLESQKSYDAAAAEYRRLVDTLAKDKDAALLGAIRDEALVGLGNCLLATKKEAEARGFFEKATSSHDADVLAGAYAGLGDAALVEAKALREGGKLPEAKAKLEEAILHYLRVTVKYRSEVDDVAPVLRALDSQARVFKALFEMSGSKDCELANRAYGAYFDLSKMLPDGPQKKAVVRDAQQLDQAREAAGCKAPAPK